MVGPELDFSCRGSLRRKEVRRKKGGRASKRRERGEISVLGLGVDKPLHYSEYLEEMWHAWYLVERGLKRG